MKTIQLIAVAILFTTACKKENDEINTAAAGQTQDLNGAKETQQRPFSITLSSSPDAASALTACSGDLQPFAIGDLFLSGSATHLGQLNAVQSRLHHENCDLSFTTAQLTTGVSGQLVGANGDKIFYTGDDVINVLNLLMQHPELPGTIDGDWLITGGTGRFLSATGYFTISGAVDFATNTFTATGTGTITY
jgi:hypothetical protein